MRIFLTGATGFIGSAVAQELLQNGHQVLGLTRSEAGEVILRAAGVQPHRGDITDLDSLRRGVEQCDGVIHTAFDHDFSRFVENCRQDARVITALGEVLMGSGRPLLITSATPMGMTTPDCPAREDQFNPASPNPRVASELAGEQMLQAGVDVRVVRLSQIHDTVKQGLVSDVVALAQRTGVSAYVGDGLNNWSAAHVTDAARLYRLALENGQIGARYHATAESALPFRQIAEAVGRGLGLPVLSLSPDEAAKRLGHLAAFAGKEMSASSEITRHQLNWTPTGPGLIADIEAMLARSSERRSDA